MKKLLTLMLVITGCVALAFGVGYIAPAVATAHMTPATAIHASVVANATEEPDGCDHCYDCDDDDDCDYCATCELCAEPKDKESNEDRPVWHFLVAGAMGLLALIGLGALIAWFIGKIRGGRGRKRRSHPVFRI